MRLILASGSKNRQNILRNMGLNFEVVKSNVEENSNKKDPKEYVMELSKNKPTEKDKKDANVYFNIGFLLSKKAEHNEAIQYLKKAYELNNADTLALFYIAYEYSCLKDYESAKLYYNKVIEQCPDYSWAYFNLASIAYQEGKKQEAFSLVQNTLDYNPKDIDAYKFGAKILVELKNLDNAQLFIEQGLAICENDGNLYYILGQINKLQKNYRGYVGNLKLAIKNHMTLTMDAKKIKNELTKFIEKQRK